MFHQVGILFPARWLNLQRDCVLPAGTPVAQCIPVRREELELKFNKLESETARAYAEIGERILNTPGIYRREFRHRG
jgi:hypothetical protein